MNQAFYFQEVMHITAQLLIYLTFIRGITLRSPFILRDIY